MYIYIYIIFEWRNSYHILDLPWPENPASTYMRIRNTDQLFRPYEVSSAVYTVISTTGDQTNNHSMHKPKLCHI